MFEMLNKQTTHTHKQTDKQNKHIEMRQKL